jgi:hypothetical protein
LCQLHAAVLSAALLYLQILPNQLGTTREHLTPKPSLLALTRLNAEIRGHKAHSSTARPRHYFRKAISSLVLLHTQLDKVSCRPADVLLSHQMEPSVAVINFYLSVLASPMLSSAVIWPKRYFYQRLSCTAASADPDLQRVVAELGLRAQCQPPARVPGQRGFLI